MDAGTGLVLAGSDKSSSLKDECIETKGIALVVGRNFQAVGVASGARLHVIEIAEQHKVVSAFFGSVFAGTAHDEMELVSVVVNNGGSGHVHGGFSAHTGAILLGGSRKDSEILAGGIVRAKWLFDTDAKTPFLPVDIPGAIGVHGTSQIFAAGVAGVGEIPVTRLALAGGSSRRGSCCRTRREENRDRQGKPPII